MSEADLARMFSKDVIRRVREIVRTEFPYISGSCGILIDRAFSKDVYRKLGISLQLGYKVRNLRWNIDWQDRQLRTLGKLAQLSEVALIQSVRVGKKTTEFIKLVLERYGLALGMSVSK